MIGFKSIVHQGWSHAKQGQINSPYPQFVKTGKGDGFQTSAHGEYMRGVGLFQQGKTWKDQPNKRQSQPTASDT